MRGKVGVLCSKQAIRFRPSAPLSSLLSPHSVSFCVFLHLSLLPAIHPLFTVVQYRGRAGARKRNARSKITGETIRKSQNRRSFPLSHTHSFTHSFSPTIFLLSHHTHPVSKSHHTPFLYMYTCNPMREKADTLIRDMHALVEIKQQPSVNENLVRAK